MRRKKNNEKQYSLKASNTVSENLLSDRVVILYVVLKSGQ